LKNGQSSDEVIVGESGPTEAGSSATQLILRCAKLYQYAAVRGIRVPASETPDHFAIGSGFGAMRREWFGRKFATDGVTWKHLRKALKKEMKLQSLPVKDSALTYTLKLFDAYVEFWLKRPRPRPVAAEYKLGPAPLRKDDPFNLFRTARLDDLSYYPEAADALCIGEAKTTSADVGSVVREYELHVQPLQYLALYNMCKEGAAKHGPVAGIVMDIAKKAYGREKFAFARVFVEIRPETVEQFVHSIRGYLIAANKIDWDADAPRSYQCTYMAGRAKVDCTYKDICRFGKSGIGNYVLRDGTSLRKYKPQPGAERMPWE
jgi:hypothetical protein